MDRIPDRCFNLPAMRAFQVLTVLLFLCACSIEERDAKIELSGNTEWFQDRNSLDAHLLDTIDSEGIHQVEWPLESERKTIDISFDVTGSVFNSEVRFSGRTQSRGDYNVEKLIEFLRRTEKIQAGDEIYLRLFGELPGGRQITVDEYKTLSCPPSQVKLRARILSRRHNDRIIQIEEVRKPDTYEILQDIRFWYDEQAERAQGPQNTYERSPLFRHITQILAIERSRPAKAFIFVTDGHFHIGDLYVHPGTFASGLTVEELKSKAEDIGLLPPQPSTDTSAEVIIIGLDDGGDSSFTQAQESILSWFLQHYNLTFVRR